MEFKLAQNQVIYLKILPMKRKSDEISSSAKKQNTQEDAFEANNLIYNSIEEFEDDLIVYSPEPEPEFNSENEEVEEKKINSIFLQHENCDITALDITKCRECMRNPECSKYTCRFFEFRKIERSNDGVCKVIGFLDKHIDPTIHDLDLWTTPEENLVVNNEAANYILSFVAGQFCEMANEEMDVCNAYNQSEENLIAWKRSVLLVREMCDVCATSLFNYHWTCELCGTSVCIDCYKERKAGVARWKLKSKSAKEERDEFYWYKCHCQGDHKLILTQMVTGDALYFLNENLHKICNDRGITLLCECHDNLMRIDGNINILTQQEIIKNRRKRLKPAEFPRMTPVEYRSSFQAIKHTWISQGQVLKFSEPSENEDAYKLFQLEWRKGKPVIVSNVTKNMRKSIWSPKYFSNRFANKKHALINCENDTVIHRVPMRHFWDGFNSIEERLPEGSDKKLILKLKDWPTASDFANTMKEHFDDLMKSVPFGAYTTRDGKYNLASYLHNHFLKPDLGPKMYSAYGQQESTKQGSTNLHLDVSDAINVLVHVSKPIDFHLAPRQYGFETVKKIMVDAGCDEADVQAFELNEKIPGAIWYIYPASDADNMRLVLNDVARERGRVIKSNEDPLHDQDWFIDSTLKQTLSSRGINPFTIIQYESDAVFIPAGAPHQVVNIFDCIKIALDFVSPENITHCFNLTSEFRKLSTRHANREDKLQIKNILYHAVKNLVPVADFE